jgi:hypothetical protein
MAIDLDLSRSVRLANLVGSKDGRGDWIDPRGLLTIRAPKLGLTAEEIARIRQTVGDVVVRVCRARRSRWERARS